MFVSLGWTLNIINPTRKARSGHYVYIFPIKNLGYKYQKSGDTMYTKDVHSL